MAKGRIKPKNAESSNRIDFESDNEELLDEVGRYHKHDRALKDPIRRKKERVEEEILNVEGDVSSSDESEGGSEFDSDKDAISDNKWGAKRKDFYGTSFVDEDWGGMREEEIEEAELEEEDALARQKLLDKSAAITAEIFEEDKEVQQNERQVELVNKEKPFSLSSAKEANLFTKKLIEEFRGRRQLYEIVVEPLRRVIELLPKGYLRSQLTFAAKTYSSYLLNAAFFLRLKKEQFQGGVVLDLLVDEHPVVKAITSISKKLKEVDSFFYKNAKELDKLKEWALASPSNLADFGEYTNTLATLPKAGKNVGMHTDVEMESPNVNFTPMEGDTKRKVPDSIAKNKAGEVTQRNSKKAKTSRTKNRKKVRAIEKRVRSQVAPVRRELNKYSGETKGIRSATVKSTKLIA